MDSPADRNDSGSQHIDFTPGPTHAPQSVYYAQKRKKRVLLTTLIVIAVLVLGGGITLLVLHESSNKPAATAKTTHIQQPVATNTGPATYKSASLGFSFTHPGDWTVKESADKAEVIVTSPRISYTHNGTATQGVFTLKMRHGSVPDAIQQTVIKQVAVVDSEIIAYAQPTANQRQYTNVSYGGPDANNFAMLIVSGNTALKAGQAFGYGVDLTGSDTYMFAGGYGTDGGDTLTFDAVSKTSYDTASFQDAMAIIKSIQIN